MRLILHIGDLKTGSSSIQATLSNERYKLRSAGILYPKCGDFKNHCILTVPFTKTPLRQFLHIAKDSSALLNKVNRIWDRVEREVKKINPSILILSAENLLSMREDEVTAFESGLRQRFPQISSTRVIGYVRKNSTHYTSRLQQRVKASWKLPRFETRLYSKHLSNWTFADELIVREMARSKLDGGDVVQDFLNLSGVPSQLTEKMTLANVNETISAEGMSIIRAFRRNALPDLDNRFHPKSGRILRAIRAIEADPNNDLELTRPCLLPSCATYLDRETPEQAQLRENYGINLSSNDISVTDPPINFRPDMPLESLISIYREKELLLYEKVLAQIMMKAEEI